MTNMDDHEHIRKERNGGMSGLKRTLDIPLTFSGLRLLQLLLSFSLQNWVFILRLPVNMAGRWKKRERVSDTEREVMKMSEQRTQSITEPEGETGNRKRGQVKVEHEESR